MSRIIALGGGGFADCEVYPMIKKIKELTGKQSPSLLYLPTAGFDDISDIGKIYDGFERYGFKCSCLRLSDWYLTEDEIAEKILSADAIYVGGGNLRFLMSVWKKTNAVKYLREAAEKGTVLSGLSSGAMCWFDMGWDDCGPNGEYMFIECLGLIPGCNCPHYESGNWNTFKEHVKECGMDGIACENGAAYCLIDGEYSKITGSDPASVFQFKKDDNWKEEEIFA